jgi:hypothetical protein
MAENKKKPLPTYKIASGHAGIGTDFNAQKYTDNPYGGPLRSPLDGKLHPQYYVKGSDAYANHKDMVINFEHVPSQTFVSFKAFITNFQETYNSDWASETVYGRIDPIYLFKNTTRDISLAFKVPAESESEAFENLGRVQKLIQFLYPNYTTLIDPNTGEPDVFANTISQSPLVRLKVMNLLTDTSGRPSSTYKGVVDHKGPLGGNRGLLGAIQNVSINHGLEGDQGVFNEGRGVVLPKLIEVTLSFRPIHEGPLGWKKRNSLNPRFPYGADLDEKDLEIELLTTNVDEDAWDAYNAQEAEKKNQNLTADASDAAQENTPLQNVAEGLTAAKDSAAASATNAWRGLTGADNRQLKKILAEPGSREG